MGTQAKKKWAIVAIAGVVVVALAFCITQFFSHKGDTTDTDYDPPAMPILSTGESPIKTYSKEYSVGGMDTEAFAVFATVQEDSGSVIRFDGFFGAEKRISELSGTSCDIHSARASKTTTGYRVSTTRGSIVFVEDASGLRIDAAASDSGALTTNCLTGVSWADMPAFTARDIKMISPEDYRSILMRG